MDLQENINLSQFTTLKIGGPARYFCEPKNQNEIIEAVNMAQKMGMPFFILGGGSNILVSDEGYEGVIIKVQSSKFKVQNHIFLSSRGVPLAVAEPRYGGARKGDEGSRLLSERVVCIESGALLKDLVDYCTENGLSGLEWAAGIPGTVGGAIRGNAGAYGGQFSDIVVGIGCLPAVATALPARNASRIDADGQAGANPRQNSAETIIINADDCQFSYRGSIFKQNSNLIILSAELKLQQGDKEEIKQKIREILEKRGKSLGKCYPSAGCVFKNPQTDNIKLIKMFEEEKGVKIHDGKIPAGYLIEKLGLKGAQIGGAVVSRNNANLILNEKNATARDVLDIIELIKSRVKREFGVELELEIELLRTDFHLPAVATALQAGG